MQFHGDKEFDTSKFKFEEYEEKIKEKTRKVINSKISSRVQLLDAIGKRFFDLSYKEMKEIAIRYSKDVNILIEEYSKKEELTPEEENELISLKIVRNIKEIINIKDKKAIVDTFNELDKDEAFSEIDFFNKIVLDENVRRVFSKDYLKDLYVPNEKDKRIIDGIEVYSPKEFNMFVHVVGAYSNFKLIDKENIQKTVQEAWDNNENKQSHILCTSYIRNSNLSYFKESEKLRDKIKKFFSKNKEDIILGFCDISKNSILMSSVSDIAVTTNDIKSQKAVRHYTFRTADNLSNNTRRYNEVNIERRLEGNRTNNIKPNFVVCFDKIGEDSKRVARELEIPIVYINNEEIAKQESEKLSKTIETYKQTKEPYILKNIIMQYFNNITSFSLTRRDLVNKYFNEDKINNQIEEIIIDLEGQCESKDKENNLNCMKTLYNSLQDEIYNYNYANNDISYMLNSKLDIKKFTFKLKNMIEKIETKPKTLRETIVVERRPTKQGLMFEKIKQIKEENYNGRE